MTNGVFDNSDDVIDSRDVIARIEELRDMQAAAADLDGDAALADFMESDEGTELAVLLLLQSEASGSPDWEHGETLIRDSYFVEYITDLIHDCYEFPKEFNSGEWPWRHMEIDYEAAADEAKADYIDVSFDGVDYWIRG